jgi:hypothetical protein
VANARNKPTRSVVSKIESTCAWNVYENDINIGQCVSKACITIAIQDRGDSRNLRFDSTRYEDNSIVRQKVNVHTGMEYRTRAAKLRCCQSAAKAHRLYTCIVYESIDSIDVGGYPYPLNASLWIEPRRLSQHACIFLRCPARFVQASEKPEKLVETNKMCANV